MDNDLREVMEQIPTSVIHITHGNNPPPYNQIGLQGDWSHSGSEYMKGILIVKGFDIIL